MGQVVRGVLCAMTKGTNFNGVVLGIQSLSMQVICDYKVRSFLLHFALLLASSHP